MAVSREDPESRQRAKREIIRRAESRVEGDNKEEEGEGEGGWPQLMIFPEGSTSNRRALMTFAPGAFNPGKPVQPVLLRLAAGISPFGCREKRLNFTSAFHVPRKEQCR